MSKKAAAMLQVEIHKCVLVMKLAVACTFYVWQASLKTVPVQIGMLGSSHQDCQVVVEVCVQIHTCIYTYIHTDTYMHIHIHTHVRMAPNFILQLILYIHTHAHTHTYTHALCTHTHTHFEQGDNGSSASAKFEMLPTPPDTPGGSRWRGGKFQKSAS